MLSDNIELRFGQLAIKMGYITLQQLIDAVAIQILEEYQNSSHRLIGMILVEKGFMTLDEVHDVLSTMGFSKKMALL